MPWYWFLPIALSLSAWRIRAPYAGPAAGRPGPGRLHPAIADQEIGRLGHDELRGHLRPLARARHRVRAIRGPGGPGLERAFSTRSGARSGARQARAGNRTRRRFVTSRGASTARFGVGAAVLPRLEALGWIVDGQPAADYDGDAPRGPGRSPTPTGPASTRHPGREGHLSRGPVGVELAPLAATSKSLWDSLLRHPEWLDVPAMPGGDPGLYVQQRICDIALADIHHRWDLETVTKALSDLADETVAFTIDRARSELAAKFPGHRGRVSGGDRSRKMGWPGAQLRVGHRSALRL